MNTPDKVEEIEKAYPEAYRLARKFHERYEEYALQFGYETRGDTKEFDPASLYGRTMARVCFEIVQEERESILKAYQEATGIEDDIFIRSLK